MTLFREGNVKIGSTTPAALYMGGDKVWPPDPPTVAQTATFASNGAQPSGQVTFSVAPRSGSLLFALVSFQAQSAGGRTCPAPSGWTQIDTTALGEPAAFAVFTRTSTGDGSDKSTTFVVVPVSGGNDYLSVVVSEIQGSYLPVRLLGRERPDANGKVQSKVVSVDRSALALFWVWDNTSNVTMTSGNPEWTLIANPRPTYHGQGVLKHAFPAAGSSTAVMNVSAAGTTGFATALIQ